LLLINTFSHCQNRTSSYNNSPADA
jgi:hypothetical protein